jgi:hypothetical protein
MHFETGTPKAFKSFSPRLQGTSYFGNTVRKALNPAGVASLDGDRWIQPRWGWRPSGRTQGKRSCVAPTLGWLLQRHQRRRPRVHEPL